MTEMSFKVKLPHFRLNVNRVTGEVTFIPLETAETGHVFWTEARADGRRLLGAYGSPVCLSFPEVRNAATEIRVEYLNPDYMSLWHCLDYQLCMYSDHFRLSAPMVSNQIFDDILTRVDTLDLVDCVPRRFICRLTSSMTFRARGVVDLSIRYIQGNSLLKITDLENIRVSGIPDNVMLYKDSLVVLERHPNNLYSLFCHSNT